MKAARVFISYSHDSPEHAHSVLDLANRLREEGIDAWIDRYVPAPPQGWPRWMEQQIAEADFVLLVCTKTYLRRVMQQELPHQGLGVLWESNLIYQHLYDAGTDNSKFIPVLPIAGSVQHIPSPIRGVQRYTPFTDVGYTDLYRRLTSQPAISVPGLGKRRSLDPIIPTVSLPATKVDGADSTLRCTNSPRAAILIPDEGLQLFVPVIKFQWDDREAKLLVEPDAIEDGAFLDGLRDMRKTIVLGYRNNVALVVVHQVQFSTIDNKDRWEITFALQTTAFSNSMEMGTPGLTADQAATRRARRILLNEAPALPRDKRNLDNVIKEMMITGQGSAKEIESSPLPTLFRELHLKPEVFLEAAWILAVLQLKLSETVEHVSRLEMTLRDNVLEVLFSGRRRKQYANRAAFQIEVSGTCQL